MSANYQQMPPTNGKVVLNTSCGDVEIELWSKEAPLACRNFIQLCMEGYYDNTMFHRIIPKFMVQGGDPTGTGEGGESCFGEPFKDEIHSRLRFMVRGIVAMANGGKDDNKSQFFMTLGPCDWLNGKHTIFGKVTGKTIYNLDAMGEYETGPDDRPMYPPRIASVEVILNPFDDIVPRSLQKRKAPEEEARPAVKVKKNKALLSFADDEEAVRDPPEEGGKKKMVSAHDALDDARLSKQRLELPSRSKEEMERDEREARHAAGVGSDGGSDGDESSADEEGGAGDKDAGKGTAGRRKERYLQLKGSKLRRLEEEQARDPKGGDEAGDEAEAERARRAREIEQLKREIRGMAKGARAAPAPADEPARGGAGRAADTELLPSLEQRRAAYKSARRAGGGRERETLEKLARFQTAVLRPKEPAQAAGKGGASEGGSTRTEVGSYGWQEALDDYDDSGWLATDGLKFAKESKVSFMQREMENDDSLASYDPLKDKRPKPKNKYEEIIAEAAAAERRR